MAYHAIPDTPLSLPPSRAQIDDCQHCPDFESKSHERLRLKTVWRLSAVNSALLVFQVALLIVHVTGGWHPVEKYVRATYGFDTKYMTLDHDYDWLWEQRAVQRAGAIALERDQQGKVTEYGVISMFHQLHCVASLRTALQTAYEGGHVAFDQNQDPHWPHCLHYLHQMITCKADSQIENQELWNKTIPFVSGAEDYRRCQDSQILFDLYERQGI